MNKNSIVTFIVSILALIMGVVAATLLIISARQIDIVQWFNSHSIIKLFLLIMILLIMSYFIFMIISVYRRHLKEKRIKEEFENVSMDNLTQMFSFKYFIKLLQRMNNPFTLILIDVDNFKEINDKFGSVIGDLVLKVIAKSIKSNIRFNDIVARYEGDAFLIILDNCPPHYASNLMERIRREIKDNESLSEKDIKLSTSVGMYFAMKGEPVDNLLRKAVQALAMAKENEDEKIVLYEN